jgi:hypothetical protein
MRHIAVESNPVLPHRLSQPSHTPTGILVRPQQSFFRSIAVVKLIRSPYGRPGQSIETTGHIRYISSKFGKFPVNLRVVVAREAYKEAWLQGPSAVVALQAACLVNTRPY